MDKLNQWSDVFVGLSTESKPVGRPTGTFWLEMDTSKIYIYDAGTDTWYEWGA